jgi:hypothetical protein
MRRAGNKTAANRMTPSETWWLATFFGGPLPPSDLLQEDHDSTVVPGGGRSKAADKMTSSEAWWLATFFDLPPRQIQEPQESES